MSQGGAVDATAMLPKQDVVPRSPAWLYRLGRRPAPLGLFRRVFSAGKTTLAVVGLGTLLTLALEYKVDRDMEKGAEDQSEEEDASETKKRVLVIPFHRMKIVEKKSKRWTKLADDLPSLSVDGDGPEKIIEIELKELVDIIHAAAADPECVALHGTFGQGNRFSAGGYAHIEEIRNAIRVFNESHRVHPEPNLSHDPNLPMPKNGTPKTSYAFADTFASPLDSGNKEFYLASEFTHVDLQPRGELDLMGLSASTPFFRSALDKYGIKVHVFKHGKFKNTPNVATEKGYTKEHLENTKSIITSINDHMCMEIVRSRSLLTFDEHMWKAINNYGTLSARNAREVGLVDNLPRINPLGALLLSNKGDQKQMEMKEKWKNEIDFDKFNANEPISLQAYSALLSKRKKAEKRKWKVHGMMKFLSEKSTATQLILSALGYHSPNYNIGMDEFSRDDRKKNTVEKIAVVKIAGIIDHTVARNVTSTLRKIKDDRNVMCVILRVDSPGGSAVASETILEECKDLSKPVICSMSNTAASGGYYVVTHCDRIFALPNTVTGSIGVFGVKFDLTELASQYGVKVENVSTGNLSSSYDLFQPLTKNMEENFNRNVDRIYDYFKQIVSSGRGMTLGEVEAVAQGRVWTGEQAVQVGLVDELGGLNRAISYAKKHFTSGEADVEVWPKPPSLSSLLMGGRKKDAIAYLEGFWNEVASSSCERNIDSSVVPSYVVSRLLFGYSLPTGGVMPTFSHTDAGIGPLSGMMLTANEVDAIFLGLQDISIPDCSIPPSSPFWV